MGKKKGQAALEFLMTYGWAILVVLIVIGALAYFGILNPSILLPEKCTLQMGLYCKDHRIDGTKGQITFNFENGMGKDIILYHVNVTGDVIPGGCYAGVYGNVTSGDTAMVPYTSITGYALCGVSDDCSGCTAVGGEGKYSCNPDQTNKFNTAFNSNVGYRVAQGTQATVVTNCTVAPLSWTGKAKTNLNIQWYYADSSVAYLHTMEGELLAKVEGK